MKTILRLFITLMILILVFGCVSPPQEPVGTEPVQTTEQDRPMTDIPENYLSTCY